jgi:hypothetical protein
MPVKCTARVLCRCANFRSFAFLHPIRRRMHDEKETGAGEQSKPLCESSFRDLYLERNRKIIKLLDELDSDIICLQEFWVDNQVNSAEHAPGRAIPGFFLACE